MGTFMALLATPMDDKIMEAAYPDTGKATGSLILEYMITQWVLILVGAGIAFLILNFTGKRYFGMLSYNITYVIRKQLYANILSKNIGYFDFPENSTPVLSSVMQSDTSIINGVCTETIPPQVEAGTLLTLAIVLALYFCW